MRRAAAIATLFLLLPPTLGAQSLAARVGAVRDGTIHLSFATRPDVCGGGHGIVIRDSNDGEWEADCDHGPVRVSLRMRGGRVASAGTWVGGRWRGGAIGASDLGTVSAPEAAVLLLRLAPTATDDGGQLISAAVLADSAQVWPELLGIARNPRVSGETRTQAIFWLGQAAGRAATRGLDSIARDDSGDLELRRQAVFALSQRPADEGVPALVAIARGNPDPEIVRTALFWLGQSDDPRALAVFEEILR